jgi:hypothetical protein
MENACSQASARLSLAKVPKARIPQLRMKRGANAKTILVARKRLAAHKGRSAKA